MTTEITQLPEDKATIAADFMAKSRTHIFWVHIGRAYGYGTPENKARLLAAFSDHFALAYDVCQLTEGPKK